MIQIDKVILICIKEQKLMLIQDNFKIAEYPISTSKFGIGNKIGSNMTPLGYHVIKEKIGDNVPKDSIYEVGKFTKEIAKINYIESFDEDLITTRIIKLDGLQKGINQGGDIDSFKRGIWIHGTSEECYIGSPASHGCIRMKNDDIIKLFDLIEVGTPINIEIEIFSKLYENSDPLVKRSHTFRLKDRRVKGILDSSLWEMNNVEHRKESERRKK